MTDQGPPISTVVVNAFRERGALLLPDGAVETIGIAGRAIVRQRAETALLEGMSADQLHSLDALLTVDPAILQTRVSWLRTAPDAPRTDNLIGLMERLSFIRSMAVEPQRREQIHPERWNQIVHEGDAATAWLVDDFHANRRRATIVAQLITLGERFTDDAITMFNKLIGRLFARANTRRQQRYAQTRRETTDVLRLFRDTLRALVAANDTGRNAVDVLDDEIGWHRLLQAQPEVEAMV